MKNNNDPVKQENKKALPKFILIVAASLAVGVLLGFGFSFLEDTIGAGFGEALDAFGAFYTTRLAGWMLYACPVLELALCLPIYFGAKKRLDAWDGEDEAVSDAIDGSLSLGIWVTGLATVLGYFLVAGHMAGMGADIRSEREMGALHVFLGLGAFLVILFGSVILQQKLVDASKRLYPEKKGSVYDTKFQKKWWDTCDEAERAIIGQCAMKAYKAMCGTCLALWAVFTLGGLFLGWGFLPAMAVCVIWGVGESVYCCWSIKLSKPGAKL